MSPHFIETASRRRFLQFLAAESVSKRSQSKKFVMPALCRPSTSKLLLGQKDVDGRDEARP
jgi:hypothetical protein